MADPFAAEAPSPAGFPLPSASPAANRAQSIAAAPTPLENAAILPAPTAALPFLKDRAPDARRTPTSPNPGALSSLSPSVRDALLLPTVPLSSLRTLPGEFVQDALYPPADAASDPIPPAQGSSVTSVPEALRRPVDPAPRSLPIAPAAATLPRPPAAPDDLRRLAQYGLRLAPVSPPPAAVPPLPQPLLAAGLPLSPAAAPLADPSPPAPVAGASQPSTLAVPRLSPPSAPATQSFRAAPAASAAPAPLQADELEPILEQLLTQALLREGVDL